HLIVTSYTRQLNIPRSFFFLYNHTATPEIYTLSLHDALPISPIVQRFTISTSPRAEWTGARSSTRCSPWGNSRSLIARAAHPRIDRKSTRLNSSHDQISYAVFCLKKKKNSNTQSLLSCINVLY